MLATDVNWNQIKATVTYQNTEWVAILRPAENTIANEPAFIRESDGACFIKRYGRFEPAESAPGFVKFEENRWRKRFLDTSTLEMIEIPLFSK